MVLEDMSKMYNPLHQKLLFPLDLHKYYLYILFHPIQEVCLNSLRMLDRHRLPDRYHKVLRLHLFEV